MQEMKQMINIPLIHPRSIVIIILPFIQHWPPIFLRFTWELWPEIILSYINVLLYTRALIKLKYYHCCCLPNSGSFIIGLIVRNVNNNLADYNR